MVEFLDLPISPPLLDLSFDLVFLCLKTLLKFGLCRSDTGRLAVTLNNGRYLQKAPVELKPDEWYSVVCSVDLAERSIRVYVNGEAAPPIAIPKDFELSVVSSKFKQSDKVWSFVNYSNGEVFHGLVDELRIYNETLSSKAAAGLKLGS